MDAETRQLIIKMFRAYIKTPEEIKKAIDQCCKIYLDRKSDQTEKMLAFNTVIDGLEPYLTPEEVKLLTI